MSTTSPRRAVLVICNDAPVRDMLNNVFTGSGFRVSLAGTGAEAVKMVLASPYEYALCDLQLPDFSGVELKRRLQKTAPATKTIVISSFSSIRSSEDVLRFGASDFIIDQRELMELVRGAEVGVATTVPTEVAEPSSGDEKLRKCIVDTIDVLVGLLEINDPFFGGNSHITMEYARSVAEEMDLGREMVDEIAVASLLHDIGRIGIKTEILQGSKEMSEADFRTIRSHCENGAKILDVVDFPWKVKPIIVHHHERYDGKGYPSGLKGREIPLGARILSVVDAFAAMTANRPYRRSLGREEAIEELHRNVGTQFDPEVVEAFTRTVERKFYFRGVGARPRVLMVDDEVDYLTLLKLKLVNEGFEVLAADSGEAALKIARETPPDILLCDVVMPGMDGLVLMSRLRETKEGAELPVIFLSGKGETSTKVEALNLGAEDFLVKPVDVHELAARLRNIIRRDERRKKGRGISASAGVVGDLKNLGIPEIVQTLHLGLKTACVTVRNLKNDEGRIWFENGRIRHCDAVGGQTGEEAFYAVMQWQEGPFIIAHGQTTTERTIERDEMQLMMEGLRRIDESGRGGV